ncbi:MAG: hypothetical protein RMY62_020225 [Nostoc sp. ZfuVER08]|uniref:Lipoprotein n=1 Tax=Nostoc punctiforme FACHB-252 TaxID=1357509 RepID=A0ABR8H800_NOSPU|nr:hypothetical protein [Nostoc punctiforme]MBD2611868.1 hypothetical protein [Nostoc punctiforme FACHB-252]MDZ8015863.1 hypothetical protein [Nostoc sp. ZfuVER08]
MNRTYFLAIFLLIGFPLTILSIYFSFNYSGFCFAKMRYFSDYDKIKLAFDSLNSAEQLRIKFAGKMQYHEFIKYESFDEYIKENPDCCAINPPGGVEAPPDSFLTRILGLHSGKYVQINFKVRYLDERGLQTSQEITSDFALENCGKVVSFD